MEFKGRIKQMLPLRSGTSQRTGNEWKAQPFIFEYFENPSDRYADSVLLESFDTNLMEKMPEGVEVKCGFGHRTREYEGRVYNEIRCYKLEILTKTNDEQADTQPQHNNPEASGGTEEKKEDDDDLPF